MNVDISIVGCGPVGATLANLLADYGHSVAIFERETEIYRAPRAIHVDDEALRVFQNIGISEKIKDGIVPFYEMQFLSAKGKVLLEICAPSDHQPYGFALSNWFFQPTLETELRAAFQQKKEVKWFEGYEVNEVEEKDGGAILKAVDTKTQEAIEVQSKYIIGCDGGKSKVRKWMNVQFENLDFDQAWMVVDTFVKSEKDLALLPALHQQTCDPYRPITYVPGVGKHRRFEFMLRADETPESISKPEKVTALIQQFIDPTKLEIVRSAVYTFHGLTIKEWKKGKLILAGDSAHQMPPFAGQGMCSGIRDAHNLAFKLDLVLNGQANEGLLDTYQEERKPHVTTISEKAIMMGKAIQSKSRGGIVTRNFLFFLARNFKFIQDKLNEDAIKKLAYKNGFLGNQHSLSGHLTIQPKVQQGDNTPVLLDEMLGNQFALMTTHPIQKEQVNHFKNKINGQVFIVGQDFTSMDYLDWMQANKMEFIIIRPDRYIFDAGELKDLDKVLNALYDFLTP